MDQTELEFQLHSCESDLLFYRQKLSILESELHEAELVYNDAFALEEWLTTFVNKKRSISDGLSKNSSLKVVSSLLDRSFELFSGGDYFRSKKSAASIIETINKELTRLKAEYEQIEHKVVQLENERSELYVKLSTFTSDT